MAESPYRYSGDELAEEYAATRARIRTHLGAISIAQSATIVPSCPDWSIQDLAAHLAGVCGDLAQRKGPTGDVQVWVDGQVAARRGRSMSALLDEWDEHGPAFEAIIRSRPDRVGGLLHDIVVHEHDARGALGQPGNRATVGVLAAVDINRHALAADLAKASLPAVRVATPRNEWIAGDGSPKLHLELEGPDAEWQIMRVLASRRSKAQQQALPWQGDFDRFLPVIFHLPLATGDLLE